MQTIWTRIAQSPAACRCAHCTVKSGLTRHVGSAAARRPTKFLTSSTLLYSGIFALAASTDAIAKERRNQRWNSAIAEAKADLAGVGHEDKGRTAEQDDEAAYIDTPEALLEDDYVHAGALWPENTGRDFDKSTFAPQSVYATPRFRANEGGRQWSRKKLQIGELAMDKLILRTLIRFQKDGRLQDLRLVGVGQQFAGLLSLPEEKLFELLDDTSDKIAATKRIEVHADVGEFTPHAGMLTRFSHDRHGQYLATADEQSRRLQQSFRRFRKGQISRESLTLSLLHGASKSGAPPGLSWWNNLIRNMSLNTLDPKLIKYTLNALRTSQVRPNEETLSIILDHFRRIDDKLAFCHWVELLQGQKRGLMLAKPDIWITERSQGRLVRTEYEGRSKVIQKPTPSPKVFAALVHGVLHFEGFEPALALCQGMGAEGWGLSMKGLTPFLQHCVARGDWASGLAVWQQVKKVQSRSRTKRRAEVIQPWTYASMLALCDRCGKREDLVEVAREAERCHGLKADLVGKVKSLRETWQVEEPGIAATSATQSISVSEEKLEQMDALSELDNESATMESAGVRRIEEVAIPAPLQHVAIDPAANNPAAAELSLSIAVAVPPSRQEAAGPHDGNRRDESVAAHRTSRRTQQTMPAIARDELFGHAEATTDLADYEFAERPIDLMVIHEEHMMA